MDFSLTEEQQMLQDSVERFLEKNYSFELRRDMVANRQAMSEEVWQGFASLGLLGVPFAEEYGGFGGEPDILKGRIIAEEFAAAQVPGGLGGQGISMLVPTLLELGTEEQKKKFIAPMQEPKASSICQLSLKIAGKRRTRPRAASHSKNTEMMMRMATVPSAPSTGNRWVAMAAPI